MASNGAKEEGVDFVRLSAFVQASMKVKAKKITQKKQSKPVKKFSDKYRMVNFRVLKEEKLRIKEKARKLTQGNVSALIMNAIDAFKPAKNAKLKGLRKSTVR